MTKSIILVDPSDATREVLARRLRAQGYHVEETASPAEGANMALCAPPVALIADLWMPGISGVQLSKLLRSEPGTADVAIILCGDTDDHRNRFWADRAGANAYVTKGRTGDLVRALAHAAAAAPTESFFFQLSGGSIDIHQRIARHLDAALVDSVIASEVRGLASCAEFERLFDQFVQFMSQVTRYRWLAISTNAPARFSLHHDPSMSAAAETEARSALGLSPEVPLVRIEDQDATGGPAVEAPIVRVIPFGDGTIGKIALSPSCVEDLDLVTSRLSLVARELGGPIRIALLVAEAERLAGTDALTGLMNRRAFANAMDFEIARTKRHGYPLSVALLDVDHFKQVNDKRGHAMGDHVLASLGQLLQRTARRTDIVARWGGEEFVLAYTSSDCDGALLGAERLREAIEELVIYDERGERIPITASIGIAQLREGEGLPSAVERADRAMYESKAAGRNRVSINHDGPASAAGLQATG